jgi:hypothetical protein
MTQEGFKRELTSIFSPDAVGYSRLMGDDEDATVCILTSYRNVISTLIRQYNGTVIDSASDNLLAEFVSGVAPTFISIAPCFMWKAKNRKFSIELVCQYDDGKPITRNGGFNYAQEKSQFFMS